MRHLIDLLATAVIDVAARRPKENEKRSPLESCFPTQAELGWGTPWLCGLIQNATADPLTSLWMTALKLVTFLISGSDGDHVRGREMRTWFQNGKDGREQRSQFKGTGFPLQP